MTPWPPLMTVLALLALSGAPPADQARFQSSVEMVKLEVRVENTDGPIRGLTPADFEVTDSGARVTDLRVESLDDVPFDLIAVIQPFASHHGDQVALFDRAARAVVAAVGPADRLGLVVASNPPRRLRAPGDAPGPIDAEALRGNSQAALLDGIAGAAAMFDESDRRRIVLVISDGVDALSALTPDMLAALARRTRPQVMFLGTAPSLHLSTTEITVTPPGGGPSRTRTINNYGNTFPGTELRKVADLTGGRIVDLRNQDPEKTVAALFARLRAGYLLSFASSRTTGWHPLTVKVPSRRTMISARAGYVVD